MLKEIKNLLAFLTVLPFRMDVDCLADSARFMFLFPLIGAFLGLIAGAFGWVLSSYVLPVSVVGPISLGLILLLTGLHHMDGLLDFGDGVMFHGSAERKIEIMHDQLTGAGAIGLTLMTYLVSAFSLSSFEVWIFIPGLIVVELSAKLSMVVGCWAGRSVHSGMNSPFMEIMHGKTGNLRLLGSFIISIAVSLPLFWFTRYWYAGLFVVITGFLTALVMVKIAHRHFNGVTGDVLGATCEISRMTCLVVLLVAVV